MPEYYREITIDHNLVGSGGVSNFPVYVDVTLGSNVANANGYDVHFMDATGTTELSFDLEHWDNSTKRWRGWVKVPNLSPSVDTVIRVYYGDSGITTNQSSTSTWSEFVGVWSLSEPSLGSGAMKDRTANANHMSNTGTKLTAGAAGKLTTSVERANDNSEVSRLITGGGVSIPQGAWTVLGWIYRTANTPNNGSWVWEEGNGYIRSHSNTQNWRTYLAAGGNIQAASGNNGNDVWTRIAAIHSVSRGQLESYRDGQGIASTAITPGNKDYIGSSGAIALFGSGTASQLFPGRVSHVFIAAKDLGAAWIETDYNNQNDPDSFYTLGSEQSDNSPPTVSLNTPNETVFNTQTPELEFTGTDPDDDDITYEVEISNKSVDTFYFDGHIAINDPDGAWIDDANAFDGNFQFDFPDTTFAGMPFAETPVDGSVDSNYLQGIGTTVDSNTSPISQVRARIKTGLGASFSTNASIFSNSELLGNISESASETFSDYVILSSPTGGWTWEILEELEVRFWGSAVENIRPRVSGVQIEVTSGTHITALSAIDPGFLNEDDNPNTDPFTSGDLISYTVQEELPEGTYDWRVRGKDPDGSNEWCEWSETREFTIVGSVDYITNVNDSSNISDTVVRVITNVLGSNVTTNDAQTRQVGNVIVDTTAIDDSTTTTTGYVRTKDDSVDASDTTNKAVSKDLTDDIEVDSDIDKSVSKSIAITAEVTDSVVGNNTKPTLLNDSINIADTSTRDIGKSLGDSIDTNDTAQESIGKGIAIDTEVSDAQSRQVGKALDDSAEATDSVDHEAVFNRANSDGVVLADLNTQAATKGIDTPVDIDTKLARDAGKTLTDGVEVDDDLLAAGVLLQSNTDDVEASDIAVQGAGKGIADTTAVDAGIDNKAIGRSVSDISNISSGIARNIGKELSSALQTSDAPVFTISKVLQNSIDIDNMVARAIGKTLADGVDIDDLVYLNQAHVHILADSVTASDLQARNINTIFSDTVSADDAITRLINNVLTDTVTVSDVLLAVVPGQSIGGLEAAIGQIDNEVAIGQANDGLQLGQTDAVLALKERGIEVDLRQLDNEVILTLRKQ